MGSTTGCSDNPLTLLPLLESQLDAFLGAAPTHSNQARAWGLNLFCEQDLVICVPTLGMGVVCSGMSRQRRG